MRKPTLGGYSVTNLASKYCNIHMYIIEAFPFPVPTHDGSVAVGSFDVVVSPTMGGLSLFVWVKRGCCEGDFGLGQSMIQCEPPQCLHALGGKVSFRTGHVESRCGPPQHGQYRARLDKPVSNFGGRDFESVTISSIDAGLNRRCEPGDAS